MLPNMEGSSIEKPSKVHDGGVSLFRSGLRGKWAVVARRVLPTLRDCIYRKFFFYKIFFLLWSPVCSIGLLLCHEMALSGIPSE